MNKPQSIDEAITLLTKLVGWAESSFNIKRLDFNRVAASERSLYEEAMKMVTDAIKKGELTRDEFERRVGLE